MHIGRIEQESKSEVFSTIYYMYVAKLIEPYCHCDAHPYEPEMGRYKNLG